MARRTDRNHQICRDRFRYNGCTVADTHDLPGFVDLVIGKHGLTVLVEVKDGEAPPSKRKLTKAEQKLHDGWLGWIEVVTCIEDCDSLVGQMYYYANPED